MRRSLACLLLLCWTACAAAAPTGDEAAGVDGATVDVPAVDAPTSTPTPAPEAPLAGRDLTLVVRKADRLLEVRSDGEVLRSYRIGLGFAPAGDKEQQGDGKTPEGRFRVARRVPKSSYYKAFLIDYPDPDDAARGLEAGLISESTAQSIRAAHAAGREPPQHSALGGLIEIHGMGSSSDWTLGCVALDNDAIDALWPHVAVGTPVVIGP